MAEFKFYLVVHGLGCCRGGSKAVALTPLLIEEAERQFRDCRGVTLCRLIEIGLQLTKPTGEQTGTLEILTHTLTSGATGQHVSRYFQIERCEACRGKGTRQGS